MPTNQADLTRLDRALIGIVTTAPEAAERIEHWRTMWVGFDPKGLRGHRPPIVGLLRRAEANLAARRDPEGRPLRARRLRQQGALVQSLRKVAAAADPEADLLRARGDEREAITQFLECLHTAVDAAWQAAPAVALVTDDRSAPAAERFTARLRADLHRLRLIFPTLLYFNQRQGHVPAIDMCALSPILQRLREARDTLLAAMVAPPAASVADETAYIPATNIVGESTGLGVKDLKDLRRVLKDHPWIKTRKPSKQRLEVHAGDWIRYLRERYAVLDSRSIEPVIKEIEQQRAKELKAKRAATELPA